MFDTLFGEGQYALKIVLGLIFVLALIALTAWLVRRFGSEHLGTGPRVAGNPVSPSSTRPPSTDADGLCSSGATMSNI